MEPGAASGVMVAPVGNRVCVAASNARTPLIELARTKETGRMVALKKLKVRTISSMNAARANGKKLLRAEEWTSVALVL